MRGVIERAAPIEKASKALSGRAALRAFVTDPDSKRILMDALAQQALGPGEIIRGGIAKAIEHLAVERSPNILIVDISGVDLPVSKLHALAEVCEPGVTVIAIGERNEIGLYRDLLYAGVTDYIVKPLTPQLLARALGPHGDTAPAGPISQKLGKMLAVVGARGGVGATTVAVNLAWHLAHDQNRRIALVDLDLQNGNCALALGTKSNSGLRDALMNPQRMDGTLVERAMALVGERLFVLNSEEPIGDEIEFSGDAVAVLVAILRAQFHYVIFDVPRFPASRYRKAFDLADLRIIVADQSLHAARDVVRLRGSFADGAGEQRDFFVVNRNGEGGRHAVTIDEISAALKLRPRAVIPFQPQLFALASTRGYVPAARRGKFADAIAGLAAELAGRPPARRWWGR